VDQSVNLKLSLESFLQVGLELVKNERGMSEEERAVDAREIDILVTKNGLREQWIDAHLKLSGSQTLSNTPAVQILRKLQLQGCRLVYTHYDTVLDTIFGTEPIFLSDSAKLEQWMAGKLHGFLHLHGCHMDHSSLVLHSDHYDTIVKKTPLFLQLKKYFKQKSVIFIGHDNTRLNPLLPTAVQVFLDEEGIIKNPPIFVSSLPSLPESFLHLPILKSQENSINDIISTSNGNSFTTGNKSSEDVARPQVLLIFNEKQSFRKLGDIIYQLNQSGEMYVRRDALTILFGNRIMYGNIITYGGNGLHQIWKLITPEGSVLQSKGLVAIGLQNSLMIWINGKPQGLGEITNVNPFHSLWNNSYTSCSSHLPTTPQTVTSVATPTTLTTPTFTFPYSLVTVPFPYPASYLQTMHPSTTLLPGSSCNIPLPVISTTPTGATPAGTQIISPTGSCGNNPLQSPPSSNEDQISPVELGPSKVLKPLRVESPVSLKTAIDCLLMRNVTFIDTIERHPNTRPNTSNSDNINAVSSSTNESDVSTVNMPTFPISAITAVSSTKSQDPSAKSQDPSTKSQDPSAKSQDPSTKSQDPSAKSQDPSTKSQDPSTVPQHSIISQPPVIQPQLPFNIIQFPSVLEGDKRRQLPLALPLTIPSPYAYIPYSVLNHQSAAFIHPTMTSKHLMSPLSYTPVIRGVTPQGIKHKLIDAQQGPASKRPATIDTMHSIHTTTEALSPQTNTEYCREQPGCTTSSSSVNHLWQFLLHLLLSPNHGNIIQWTGQGYEFSIIDPNTIISMWSNKSNNPSFTLNGLIGELRSYSGLNILEKVDDKELTYQFKIDIQSYLRICADTITNKLQ
jgi:hypothetical protein